MPETRASKRKAEYTVGWISAQYFERAAAVAMLDEEHERPIDFNPASDPNSYTWGRIGQHDIVIASASFTGTTSAAATALAILASFPRIRFGLSVGVGGGIPSDNRDIRLGDIAVSTPSRAGGGVVQYDPLVPPGEKWKQTGHLNSPPALLLKALNHLRGNHELHGSRIAEFREDALKRNPRLARPTAGYIHQGSNNDRLFQASYIHVAGSNCENCVTAKEIDRFDRQLLEPEIQYGSIASGDSLITNASLRDSLAAEEDFICLENEAAGLMNDFPCLVIRGISSYADSHANERWQRYAAINAAAFAKELLNLILPVEIHNALTASEVMNHVKEQTDRILTMTQEIGEKMDTTILDKLVEAEGAAFDSYSDQLDERCHPETRVELRCQVQDWIKDPKGKCMFWLNGGAGTGKSTIARTVAQECSDQGLLGASFFFKRGEGDRGNASRFFATIARQLAQNHTSARSYIEMAIIKEPGIWRKTMKDQFERLILQPLSNSALPLATVIVVDALDECEGEASVTMIIHLLTQVQAIRSAAVRVLLTSRPELPIRLGFEKVSGSTYQHLVLHQIPQPIIEHDIDAYLRTRLAEIGKQIKRPSPPDWPGEERIKALVARAVPLFIVAATLCRFIGDIRWSPEKRLDQYIACQTTSQTNKLDDIYLPVLNQLLVNLSDREKEELASEFRRIIGSITVLADPLSSYTLSRLLSIDEGLIGRRLNLLHSVLNVPEDQHSPVRLLHLSFREFLLDPAKRAKEFSVDEREAHMTLASRCLDVLLKTDCLKQDICGLQKPGILRGKIDGRVVSQCIPSEVRYACHYWVYHLQQSKSGIFDQHQAHTFLKQRFLYWLEALSLMGRISESINMIATLQTLVDLDNRPMLRNFLSDAKRFVLKYIQIIDEAPLQLYSSAMVFTPEKSIIRESFKEHIPRWLKRLPKVQKNWNATLQTLEGHSLSVNSVAFSRDGKQLASGSSDNTIKLWDTATGSLQQTLEGHLDWVSSVAFSHDGKQLASGSYDNTIRLWDTATGSLQQTLDVDVIVHKLSFRADASYLDTDRGSIVIEWIETHHSFQQPYQRHVFVRNKWISWKETNVLWLPPDYRGYAADYHNGVVAMGHPSGLVTFFEIDFEENSN